MSEATLGSGILEGNEKPQNYYKLIDSQSGLLTTLNLRYVQLLLS